MATTKKGSAKKLTTKQMKKTKGGIKLQTSVGSLASSAANSAMSS